MPENTDQNNSEHGRFLRSEYIEEALYLTIACIMIKSKYCMTYPSNYDQQLLNQN